MTSEYFYHERNLNGNIDKNAVWDFFQEIKDDLLKVTADIKINYIGKLLPE